MLLHHRRVLRPLMKENTPKTPFDKGGSLKTPFDNGGSQKRPFGWGGSHLRLLGVLLPMHFNFDALRPLKMLFNPKYSFVLYGKILEPYEVSHSYWWNELAPYGKMGLAPFPTPINWSSPPSSTLANSQVFKGVYISQGNLSKFVLSRVFKCAAYLIG